jgi:hypothetical protein
MFNIHRSYEPVYLISYDYYKGKARITLRNHDASRIILSEKFNSKELQFTSHHKRVIRLLMRYVYYKIPAFLCRNIRKISLKHE